MNKKHCACLIAALIFFLTNAGMVFAGLFASTETEPMKGFDHLLRMATSETCSFDPSKVSEIMEHVDSEAYMTQPELSEAIASSASSYYGFQVNTEFSKLLSYCYNSDIPSCAVMPSVIRVSSWRGLDGDTHFKLPDFSSKLKDLDSPLVVRAIYYMQNTPDTHTGAYYGYDSYRTVILFKYKGKNALLSILKQKDISDVGRKGLILGDNGSWDYLYTGEKGLNTIGLGWVRSYIYDSFSVSVYIESDGPSPAVRCGTYKWMSAGWAGNNVIRSKHILGGLKRFSLGYKSVLESENLPSPDAMEREWRSYRALSLMEIRGKMKSYLSDLAAHYGSEASSISFLTVPDKKDDFILSMSASEMCSDLMVGFIKNIFIDQDREPGRLAFNKDTTIRAVN